MIRFLFLWLYFTLLLTGSLKAQIEIVQPKEFPVRVAIRLLDVSTEKPVPYASVRFSGTKKGLVADSNGFFSVVLTIRDTLIISSLGYEDAWYVKNPAKQTSYYERIWMKSKIFDLKPVQIVGRRTIDLDNPMLRWQYKAKFMPKVWLFYEPTGEPPDAPSLMSPISYLYDRYSARGKANRKLRDMVAERARKKRNAMRYNAEKVKRWTGMGDDEIDEFMRFCPMPDAFIDTATEYEIIERTFRCLEDFDNRERR